MKKNIKNAGKALTASGITLISLVVTVMLLIILSSISVRVSLGVYQNVIFESYIAKMKVIQSGVDNFVSSTDDIDSKLTHVSKLVDSSTTVISKFIKNGNIDIDGLNINTSNSWDGISDINPDNYYYFTSEDLEKYLGVKDVNLSVIINFNTRNVISYQSAIQDEEEYHRQYDLIIGDQLI